MKSVILLLAIAGLSDLTWAQREIEGFTLLGPVPSSGHTTSKFYYISTDLAEWSVAFKSCVDQGGQLATPSNPVLDGALRQYIVTDSSWDVWAGGKASGNVWRWQTTDQAFTYQMFDANTPSCNVANSCLHVGHNTATLAWNWCGINCTTARKYVCEF